MPRMISFSMTKQQFVDGTKDVTRRMGWLKAKPGDVLMAVEQAMGLGKGGKVKQLGLIRLVHVSREPLDRIVTERKYGAEEVRREGFPEMTTKEFVLFFCEGHRGCKSDSHVTRLEFSKLSV